MMAEPCTSKMTVDNSATNNIEPNRNSVIMNFPLVKPRYKPLISPIVSSKEITKEILERAEKKQKFYPDGVDVLLAMKAPCSPLKPPKKEESKLDACELLSILQDGAEMHYVEKPKPKVPRLSRGLYKDLKIDPDLEKKLALQQLMEFSRKRGRPRKSEAEKNNNTNASNNNETKSQPESTLPKGPKKINSCSNGNNSEPKKTPNRELKKLLQDEGAINMLYSVEKGDDDCKDKLLLSSKRRKKKALVRKAQEVTEALLGSSSTSPGLSLRHRSIAEKRKPSTDSVDSEEHSDFNFTPPSDSKIIRRHSSSSSYSSRASSPRLSSPPPPSVPSTRTEDIKDVKVVSELAEQFINARCKELNIHQHTHVVKNIIHEKQNGFKERLQSELSNKFRIAASKVEVCASDKLSEKKNSDLVQSLVDEWHSDEEGGQPTQIARSPSLQTSPVSSKTLMTTPSTSKSSSVSLTPSVPAAISISSTSSAVTPTTSVGNTTTVAPSAVTVPSTNATGTPVSSEKRDEKRIPREVCTYREIALTMSDGLASLILATNSTFLPHAFSTKVLRELSLALEYVSQNTDVKCITLLSEGPDFCLGFDLPGLLTKDLSERRALAAQAALAIKEFACKMCMLGKPVVAGVRGRAVGLGVVLLAYCDIILAEPGSTFMTPYPRLGCFPEAAATTLLPHVIGFAQSKKLLIAGAKMSCMQAEACGLVTRLVPEPELEQEVLSVGKDVLTQSHQAMASTKAIMMHSLRTKLPSVLETEVKLLQQYWTSDDCQRRISELVNNPPHF